VITLPKAEITPLALAGVVALVVCVGTRLQIAVRFAQQRGPAKVAGD